MYFFWNFLHSSSWKILKNVKFLRTWKIFRSQTIEITLETYKKVKRNRKIAKFSACGGPNKAKEHKNIQSKFNPNFFYILQKQIKKHWSHPFVFSMHASLGAAQGSKAALSGHFALEAPKRSEKTGVGVNQVYSSKYLVSGSLGVLKHQPMIYSQFKRHSPLERHRFRFHRQSTTC